jgi:hypothetical protein
MGHRLELLAWPLFSPRQLCFVALIAIYVFNAAATVTQTVTVQMLNGKNGRPIAKAKIYISFPDEPARKTLQLTTDSRGEIQFEVNGSNTFQVHQIGYATCDEQPGGTQPRSYPIDTILNTGLVSANECGHIHVQPERGRLVFFVRHGTWAEWLKE